jgi:general stress protein YciG
MSGTRAGGQKAAAKNQSREPGFYRRIGAIGGANGKTGGFAANPELARIAGAKGGRISRRRRQGESAEDYAARLRATQQRSASHFRRSNQMMGRL